MFNKKLLMHLINCSGMSLSALGREMGIAHSTLSLLSRGLSNPQPETVNSIARYFGLTPAQLFIYPNPNKNLEQSGDICLGSMGDTLKYLLQRSGMVNSSQLNKYTGIAIQTIDRIISGETTSPSHNTLIKLCEFFNITILQLKGSAPLPKGKIFYTEKSSNRSVPVLLIDNVIEWLKEPNEALVIKYVKSEVATLSRMAYAVEYQINSQLSVTYIIEPHLSPAIGDTIIAQVDNQMKILECIKQTLYLTVDYKNVLSSNIGQILGVSVQEVRCRKI
ncbi:MAG: helix-turn-helix transcriptional regulator [Burkholderiales bacterium]|nr:helix-turn-helix transcriptional regulator [Burkholderiales bacterium]